MVSEWSSELLKVNPEILRIAGESKYQDTKIMWGRRELDFDHISKVVSQSATAEDGGWLEVSLDVQEIIFISLDVSMETSKIIPIKASTRNKNQSKSKKMESPAFQ